MAAFKWKGYDLTLEFEGAEKLVRFFKEMPDKFSNKVLIKILRKGGAVVNSEIKKQIPANLKGIGAALDISVLDKAESPAIIAGFFRGKRYFSNKTGKKRKAELQTKEVKFDAATIAYWHNFGTMANRTSAYRFRTPRKKKTANRRGGIKAGLFFQKGAIASKNQANDIVVKDMDNILEKELLKLK